MLPSRSQITIVLVIATSPLSVLAEEFVTAKGKVVQMPDINVMTCEQIERTLAQIDSTRYRENAPTPLDHADAPLHQYEVTLAKALFQVCVVESQLRVKAEEAPPQSSGQE